MGILEHLARDKPLKSLFSSIARRRSPDSTADVAAIPELSAIANSVVSRCSRILLSSPETLQKNFETEIANDNFKQSTIYARQFLDYCCHKALHEITARPDYLSDRDFSSLTYDMMLAWEDSGPENELILKKTSPPNLPETEDKDESSLFYENSTSLAVQVDSKKTVGLSGFTKIAPCCPLIADFITVQNLFDALTSSSGGQLHFFIYDKYLKSLDKALKSAKSNIGSRLVLRLKLSNGEIILASEGGAVINAVLQHIGISAWPGRLTLTTHALYFESLKIGFNNNNNNNNNNNDNNNNKLYKYDLSTELKQVVKPGRIGPLGARLFDKAVVYISSSLTEQVSFDFPELKGNSRRDYWLEIVHEILHLHRFIRRFNLIEETQIGDSISKSVLAIFRYTALRDSLRFIPSNFKTILTFNLANRLQKGDVILEALYGSTSTCPLPFSLNALDRLGFNLLGRKIRTGGNIEASSVPCVMCTGGTISKSLELALKESFGETERAEAAIETVDLVRGEGIDTNVALLLELLFPVVEFGKIIHSLVSWEDPFKSTIFLILILYLIHRGWFSYVISIIFLLFAISMLWHKYWGKREPLDALKIQPPPSKNPVRQIFTLQDSIAKLEDLLKELNIALLKLRTVLFSGAPKATEMAVLVLLALSVFIAFVPFKHVVLLIVLETLTREMPLRKENTDKFSRRVREWWARIPVAPVQIIRSNKSKKND